MDHIPAPHLENDADKNDPLITRRAASERIVKVTLAGMASMLGLLGCTKEEHSEKEQGQHTHKDHGHEEHHRDPDALARRMQEQQRHPFFLNANEWRRMNEDTFRRGFDLSNTPVTDVPEYCIEDALRLGVQEGARIRRSPGSTILQGREATLRRIQACVQGFQAKGNVVRYRANAHADCGAGIVFAREQGGATDTDGAAEREIRARVAALRDMGIDASFGRRVPLSEMDRESHAHKAVMGIISPDGRFHDWRLAGLPASFTASSHDPTEISHSVDIMLKVASGSHGYGDMLKNFKILMLRHPDDQHLSQQMLTAAQDAATAYARPRNINVDFIEWNLPRPC